MRTRTWIAAAVLIAAGATAAPAMSPSVGSMREGLTRILTAGQLSEPARRRMTRTLQQMEKNEDGKRSAAELASRLLLRIERFKGTDEELQVLVDWLAAVVADEVEAEIHELTLAVGGVDGRDLPLRRRDRLLRLLSRAGDHLETARGGLALLLPAVVAKDPGSVRPILRRLRRAATLARRVSARFDDTDIVHVVCDALPAAAASSFTWTLEKVFVTSYVMDATHGGAWRTDGGFRVVLAICNQGGAAATTLDLNLSVAPDAAGVQAFPVADVASVTFNGRPRSGTIDFGTAFYDAQTGEVSGRVEIGPLPGEPSVLVDLVIVVDPVNDPPTFGGGS